MTFHIPYHTDEYKIDKEAFERVCKAVEGGEPLNLTMIGAIFGTPFWQLIVLSQTVLSLDKVKKEIQVHIHTTGT